MTELQKRLLEMRDGEYAVFQAKLAPTIPPESCIGVRLPALRSFARDFAKEPGCEAFLAALPHEYYDENMLHAVLLGGIRDYRRALELVERFLPYVDNWAACDTLRPRVFAKHKAELLPHVRAWIASPEVYTCRFGLNVLMELYLNDEDFSPEYPQLACAVTREEYYVRMMVAWYFATALAKQWDAAIPYIEQRRLPEWTHRKAIQKAIESYRITPEQKEYLRTLR